MIKLSRIDVVGGGPAGLYAAILLKEAQPGARVRVFEQNPPDATFGFGVVFSDQALDFLKGDDPATHDLIAPEMEHWRNMTLVHRGEAVMLDGIGFSAIDRLRLLQLLQERAAQAGVELRFEHTVRSLDELDGDLIVGADGLNSLVRTSDEAAFRPRFDHFHNRFAWFGTPRPFEMLTQTFVTTEHGAMNAHHYRYTPEMSTFIVECDAPTFEHHGFDAMGEEETARALEAIFGETLQGAPLVSNRSIWRRFPQLWCERWTAGNRVLLGDAAHTAHFSVGSGTRLAMEDAIALARAVREHTDLQGALAAYQSDRQPIARKIVDAATTSGLWYERFAERMQLAPLDFAFGYVTRSGRIDMDRLRVLSPRFMARYQAHIAGRTAQLVDPVGEVPGAAEIGFDKEMHPNCSAILFDNLNRNPDAVAVTGPAGTMTYRELCAAAARWGHAFAAHGLARGERIAFLLDDTPTYPAAFFGAVRAGFVPVLLNTQTTPDLLAFFLTDTDASIAVCEAGFEGMFLGKEMAGTNVERIVVANGADPLPEDRFIHSDEFINGRPETLSCAGTGPDDMAFWMYSSGSTGRPNGIVHLHHDMAYTQQSFAAHILKLTADDICFSVPKIFFAYGFGNAFTFPFSVGATTVLLPGRPEAGRVLDAIETFRPTVFYALPTLYTALCRAKGVARRDFSSLRLCLSAAEILSEDVFNAWKSLTGLGPVEALGSTEMLHIYLSNTAEAQRLGSAGRRVPGYEVELRDQDGRPAPPGAEGIMWVRGHSSAPCYWNRPDKTRETMRGDWVCTGDRFVERDGFYYFQGRADDLIKVSGQWVWPLEVERCLNEHPHVHECAVLPHSLPDRRMTLRAVVRLRDGFVAGESESRLLQDYVKSILLPYKYPRIVDYVDELPKTGTGKIDRQALSRLVVRAQ